jgi:hypothetical protein
MSLPGAFLANPPIQRHYCTESSLFVQRTQTFGTHLIPEASLKSIAFSGACGLAGGKTGVGWRGSCIAPGTGVARCTQAVIPARDCNRGRLR